MKKINGGATIWARQTTQSDVFYWKPDKWFKIWFYIVNKVNHKDNKLFKRGTNFITYKEIEVATKATHSQVDKFIRWSKQTTMLTTRKTTRGMVVKVLNYAFFQDLKNYTDDTVKDTPDDTQTIRRRFKDDTINKNGKNGNNDKKNTFDQFYFAYPRKVQKSVALKSWIKLNPDNSLLEVILKDIAKKKKTDQWKKDNGKFIQYPATYLNQKRWEDEDDNKPNFKEEIYGYKK